jgi:hypothetical protein
LEQIQHFAAAAAEIQDWRFSGQHLNIRTLKLTDVCFRPPEGIGELKVVIVIIIVEVVAKALDNTATGLLPDLKGESFIDIGERTNFSQVLHEVNLFGGQAIKPRDKLAHLRSRVGVGSPNMPLDRQDVSASCHLVGLQIVG